jgi:hypothetical protein
MKWRTTPVVAVNIYFIHELKLKNAILLGVKKTIKN